VKIIVALDLTDKDNALVPAAARLAQAANAEVVLLHVVNPFVDSAAVPAATRAEAVQQVVARAEARLHEYARAFSTPVEVRVVELERGGEDVDSCITRVTRDLRGDILVVASKRVYGLTGLILGSVAQSLLRQSPCPVLVVRPG
jgi:nucleotide-binding universal stress UspA family protein